MDWAIERRLPIKEYLELEDQPESKTAKIITELTQKNIKKEYVSPTKLYTKGIVNQVNIAKNKDNWGAIL